MNEKFKVGDVVTLKSGSVKMTIFDIYNDNNYVKVLWFDQLTNTIKFQDGLPTITLVM